MSIRTVIDFSPLSETTMPCRTLAALASGGRGPRAGRAAFAPHRGALLASQLGLRFARLGALRRPLLGAELRPGLVRPPRPLEPPPLLPGQIVLRVLLGGRLLSGGGR